MTQYDLIMFTLHHEKGHSCWRKSEVKSFGDNSPLSTTRQQEPATATVGLRFPGHVIEIGED